MRSKSVQLMNDIVDYIDVRFAKDNKVPTMQEIADHFRMTKGGVCQYIQVMVQRGIIEKDNGARCLVTPKIKKFKMDTTIVPIIDNIVCGTPILAEENIASIITLPREITGKGSFYILKATDNSMIDAGINDGDLVLVQKTKKAKDGQIVVALVDKDITIKRIFFNEEKNIVILHPENKAMKDMVLEKVSIQGIAVNIIKKI